MTREQELQIDCSAAIKVYGSPERAAEALLRQLRVVVDNPQLSEGSSKNNRLRRCILHLAAPTPEAQVRMKEKYPILVLE